jgi:hypothetical protein
VNKPGGVPVSIPVMMTAANLALDRIRIIHSELNTALNRLEADALLFREERKLVLRNYMQYQEEQQQRQELERMDDEEYEDETAAATAAAAAAITIEGVTSKIISKKEKNNQAIGGIDRDDPILDWNYLHNPVHLRDS